MDLGAVPTPEELAELSGADLDHALVELETARRKLESAYVAVLDRADDTGRFRIDGHASVRGWAMALTNSSSAETRRRLQTMRALRDLPEAGRHLADGAIGVEQAREIARLHANPRLRQLVIDGDARLVGHATARDYESFSEALSRWAQFGDPHGAEQRHTAAHDGRDAVMFERDGVVHVHARCGTGQAALMEMFQHQCDAEFLADWEQAEPGAGAVGDRPHEPAGAHGCAAADGRVASPRGARCHHLPRRRHARTAREHRDDQGRVRGRARRDDGWRPAFPATVDDVDTKRCETTTGITMSTRDAVIASMIGYVRRVVIDSSGRVTHLGRRRRFTGAAREAVLLDGRRCLWPGCGRASSRNQIDHTHEHARGGLTTPENGGPACGRHNRLTTRGYTAHRDADGVWHVHRPDGSELTEPAAA
jgi:hypothetical protein